MAMERFSLQNLPKLDFGVIPAAFNAEMSRVIADCQDRPADDKPRTVTIKFSVTPRLDTSGATLVCDEVDIGVDIESKVPAKRTKVYTMRAQADHSLLFRPDVPEDPDQMEIEDEVRARRAAGAAGGGNGRQ